MSFGSRVLPPVWLGSSLVPRLSLSPHDHLRFPSGRVAGHRSERKVKEVSRLRG